jgi:two-component system sensor histidine kinase KdpD
MTLGVVGIRPRDGYLLPDQTIVLETFVGLLGSALERSETAEAADKAKLLAEKERMRNILLSSVSHDLRSPLAAITGAADTLLQGKAGGDNQLLVSIRHEAARLTRIVSNLLDITRIEGGQLKLKMHPYDPAEIIGSAAEACRETLKGHVLSLNVSGSLPFVQMDGLLMSQVIQNLLENAGHHTPPGTKVQVEADIHEGGLRITVSDNGPGIPPGQEREIFNKFATFSHGDRPKGAGLGLSICQAIVMAHLGKIHAENGKDGGSRFIIELPANLTLPERP